MKLIDLHKEWCENKTIPNVGLCNQLKGTPYINKLKEFSPTPEEESEMLRSGLDRGLWASGVAPDHTDVLCGYTPLRQTIVLLICAMNNEL